MPKKMYLVRLSAGERHTLITLIRKGELKTRKFKRALILLRAHDGFSDEDIMASLNVSRSCVERTRKRFTEGGLERCLTEEPRTGLKRLWAKSQAVRQPGKAPEGHSHAGALLQVFTARNLPRGRKLKSH